MERQRDRETERENEWVGDRPTGKSSVQTESSILLFHSNDEDTGGGAENAGWAGRVS